MVPRWEHADRPLIEAQVRKLCPGCRTEYANAENDVTRQRQQMISMITKGARVLILDAADTRALRSSIQEADRAGVPVIAYDRLAEGPITGYVGFDGVMVGRLQGEALLKALGLKAGQSAESDNVVMMNGDPTSPNAESYRKGALSVLTGEVRIARSYNTPGWSTQNAHTNMNAAIAALGPDRIDAVLAANDNIAAGVVAALKSAGCHRPPARHRPGRRPRRGAARRQGRAVHDGLQAVREGGRRGRRHGRRRRPGRGPPGQRHHHRRQPHHEAHPGRPAPAASGDGP